MTFDPIQLALLGVVVLDALIILGIVIARLVRRREGPSWPVDSTTVAAEIVPPPEAPPPTPVLVAGADGERPWADPATAPIETIEWRRALDRETARAARYGRPATIMQLEIDTENAAHASTAEPGQAESLLLGLISTRVRASDYVARTAPRRFHVILSETPDAQAAAVADRIRAEFMKQLPDGPNVMIGWAGTAPQDGPADALWRAAERVHEDRRRLRAMVDHVEPALAGNGHPNDADDFAMGVAAAPPAPDDQKGSLSGSDHGGRVPEGGSSIETDDTVAGEDPIEGALVTLERIRNRGLVTDEEYRAKRSEILSRL